MRRFRKAYPKYDRDTGEVKIIEYKTVTECAHVVSILKNIGITAWDQREVCVIKEELTKSETFHIQETKIVKIKLR